jgi:hypothetical protein
VVFSQLLFGQRLFPLSKPESCAVLVRVPVLKKVHGKFAKKDLPKGTKIILKKYISQICFSKKVLIWADLRIDQKFKDIVHPEKVFTLIFLY